MTFASSEVSAFYAPSPWKAPWVWPFRRCPLDDLSRIESALNTLHEAFEGD